VADFFLKISGDSLVFSKPAFYTIRKKNQSIDLFSWSAAMENHSTDMLPQALLIGLPTIDAQHENIFRRIESLKESCYGNGPDSLDEFASLLNYLEFHFASEEALAKTLGVDFFDHSTVHRNNLQSLHRAFDSVRNGTRDVHSFLRYAEYWFERHIAEEDKPFAARVHARNQQTPTVTASTSAPCLSAEIDVTTND